MGLRFARVDFSEFETTSFCRIFRVAGIAGNREGETHRCVFESFVYIGCSECIMRAIGSFRQLLVTRLLALISAIPFCILYYRAECRE